MPKSSVRDITIKSEKDAFAVLKLADEGKVPEYGKIIFDGWPSLNLYLKGAKFEQSLTPTVMKGLIEFQRGIYQSYAAAKYSHPTKRLSSEEKDDLELKVEVHKGSADLQINFQEIAIKLVEQLGSKMNPTEVLIAVVAIATLYFGRTSYKDYLENRVKARERESTDEVQKETLKQLRFSGEQETERMKIIASLASKDGRIENITRIAHDTQTDLIRSLAAGDSAKVEGVALTPEQAEELTRNARRKSSHIRLDGVYRLLKIDWSDSLKFKVRVSDVASDLQLDAEVQDESLTGQYKAALREAEWSRKPVRLEINARVIGDSEYRDAVIVSAKAEK
jgi:hypothetical protein